MCRHVSAFFTACQAVFVIDKTVLLSQQGVSGLAHASFTFALCVLVVGKFSGGICPKQHHFLATLHRRVPLCFAPFVSLFHLA